MNPEPATVVAETRIVREPSTPDGALVLQPIRMCGQPTEEGPCQNTTNTAWFEKYGWRCRFHIPDGEHWPEQRRGQLNGKAAEEESDPEDPPDPMPKDGVISSFEDAQAMIQWAGREAGKGRITESRSRAVVNAAKAYMVALRQGDESERGKKIYEGLRRAGYIKE